MCDKVIFIGVKENKKISKRSDSSIPSPPARRFGLVLLLIVSSSSSTLALLCVLSLDTARTSSSVRRAQGEVDVLLTVQTHHKRRDIHHLLTHTTHTHSPQC